MRRFWLAMMMGVVGLALVLGVSGAQAAHDLADILYEKGQITKEEWLRAKADSEKAEEEQRKSRDAEFPISVRYKDGFDIQTRDGKFEMLIQNRLQFRFSYPQEGDSLAPADAAAADDKDHSSFRVRRARIKVGGHGFVPWLKYYVEYDWASNTLLDYRLDIAKFKWATLRVGQWKIDYNRERVDSSGAQQFVERSIVNAPFTLDRQIGARLGGHLFEGTYAYLVYNIGVFTGTGINNPRNDDKKMLWMGRIQWNFLGRDVPFSQSDPEYTPLPIGSIAFAGAHNRTDRIVFPGSRNSTVVDGQFEVDQGVQEFAFKWNGLSIQEEFHVKHVTNETNQQKTTSYGAYAQVGYFPHALIDMIPKELEFAYRYAFVDPNDALRSDVLREHTVAANWFFAKHRNKLTLDYSHLTQPGFTPEDRVRLQWDVSF
ncbi:MAG: OprO/OprP family phosphate-selective porin [Nitrospira sp.]|nr:OprO/OprP family phosphate-selective porin [Nitrospira sp.]